MHEYACPSCSKLVTSDLSSCPRCWHPLVAEVEPVEAPGPDKSLAVPAETLPEVTQDEVVQAAPKEGNAWIAFAALRLIQILLVLTFIYAIKYLWTNSIQDPLVQFANRQEGTIKFHSLFLAHLFEIGVMLAATLVAVIRPIKSESKTLNSLLSAGIVLTTLAGFFLFAMISADYPTATRLNLYGAPTSTSAGLWLAVFAVPLFFILSFDARVARAWKGRLPLTFPRFRLPAKIASMFGERTDKYASTVILVVPLLACAALTILTAIVAITLSGPQPHAIIDTYTDYERSEPARETEPAAPAVPNESNP
jgi:hypothetical protein